jgi:polar amino acid transport system substrate-binding protein
LFSGCEDSKKEDAIVFGTSADYPPFEHYEDGDITGFEIDLARAVANKLGKEANFKDMSFSSILTELQHGSVDVGVSALNPTEERRKNYDFTTSYYSAGLALVYQKSADKFDIAELSGVKIACQLGSVPEKWLKQNRPAADIISIDNVAQSVEFIKAGHAVGILVDNTVAFNLCTNNPELTYMIVADSIGEDGGCAMAIKKESPLKKQIDDVLQQLENSGELQALKVKWKLANE